MTIGLFQIAILALIAVLLFGRGRISQGLGELGESVRSVRRAVNERDDLSPVLVESGEVHSAADK